MNVLGLDYGASHIGVAIVTGPLAEPLTTIPTSQALRKIKLLVEQHQITQIVLGDAPPDFIASLKILNLPLQIVDETLSSHDARLALLHTTQTRRQDKEHQASAALILQSWLDSHIPIL